MLLAGSFLSIQTDKDKIKNLDKCIDIMHYDIMDGIFTDRPTIDDNIIVSYDISKAKDVHLMVNDVKKYVDIYKKINPLYITFHLENNLNIMDNINYIKNNNIKVGLAINPSTNVRQLNPYLKYVDLVLVMSVKAGAGGQEFIDITDKIDYLYNYRKDNNLNYVIEVDGGINDVTIKKITKADIAVIGSFITKTDNYKETVNKIRGSI